MKICVSIRYRITWSIIKVSYHSYCIVNGSFVFLCQWPPTSQLGIIVCLLSSVFKLSFFHNSFPSLFVIRLQKYETFCKAPNKTNAFFFLEKEGRQDEPAAAALIESMLNP